MRGYAIFNLRCVDKCLSKHQCYINPVFAVYPEFLKALVTVSWPVPVHVLRLFLIQSQMPKGWFSSRKAHIFLVIFKGNGGAIFASVELDKRICSLGWKFIPIRRHPHWLGKHGSSFVRVFFPLQVYSFNTVINPWTLDNQCRPASLLAALVGGLSQGTVLVFLYIF